MPLKRLLAIVLALGVLCPAASLRAQDRERDEENASIGPRRDARFTILQLNDVYSMTPVDGRGGLARVATLKRQVAAEGRPTVLVLAGDFLSPSVASTAFKGAQMIAALNAAGVDYATLGNHEFDFGRDVLLQRMKEAAFQWVVSNVIDRATGKPIGGAAPFLVRTIGGVRVGLIGLCLTTTEISPDKLAGIRMVDPLQAAARYIPMLKRRGATVIVAITHLAFRDDRRLATRFPDIDLIIGGHEHYPIAATEGPTLISKAGSDAKWVARIDVGRPSPGGPLERLYELMPITSALPDDAGTAAAIKSYMDRLDAALNTVVGRTAVPLDAQAPRLRTGETNLGNFIADVMRAHVAADLALVNAGGIRGERLYPAGPLTRRTLTDMVPFGNVICEVQVPGRVVRQALENGVSQLPDLAGRFPQVSGFTMTFDPEAPSGSRVREVRVHGQPLDPAKLYTLALPDYVLGGGDGYSMFAGQRVIVSPEAGDSMLAALERAVATNQQIAPATDGRISRAR